MKHNHLTTMLAAGFIATGVFALSDTAHADEAIRREVRSKTGEVQRVEQRSCEHWSVYFERGQYALLDETRYELARMARCFESDSVREIAIIGSADSSGSALDNLALAEARANAVRRAFAELGITSPRIRVYAIGDQLSHGTDDAESRAVVIVPRR